MDRERDDMQSIPRPRFDATLNWGHMVIAVTFLVTAAGQWFLTDYRLRALEDSVKSLSALVVTTARIDERMNDYGRRLDKLETRRAGG